ncbi:MAG TPA: lipid-binding SYLF domain-containing protein [Candidatus Methylacidiphilales bacterium]|nr:lipid-binding SYLF domain-containing protein [Candidatus Methylacidiphilales bacterium]
MHSTRFIGSLFFLFGLLAMLPAPIRAASAYELDRDGRIALQKLYAKNPKAIEVAYQSAAVLVFPTVVKGGFIFGAQGGDGVLISNGNTLGYYNTSAVSYGLQAGVQKYGYALFFMNHRAMDYLRRSNGWEVGVGPSFVVVDAGVARTLTTTTMKKDIYAFIFNQKGLMAGLGLQGAKITPYTPSE